LRKIRLTVDDYMRFAIQMNNLAIEILESEQLCRYVGGLVLSGSDPYSGQVFSSRDLNSTFGTSRDFEYSFLNGNQTNEMPGEGSGQNLTGGEDTFVYFTESYPAT
jgi:hypothetical protein